jgi:hypothetical protein
MIDIAHVSHGRTDDRHDWQVNVYEASLWRLWLSGTLETVLHTSRLCCSQWVWRMPFVFIGKASYRLLNAICRIDNSHLHRRYTFKVTDAWAKEHAPEFWAEMHDLYAEEDAAQVG